nr:GGDEF domain-containing protein [Kineosporia babensis]
MTCVLITDITINIDLATGGSGFLRLPYLTWAFFYVCLGIAASVAAGPTADERTGPTTTSGLTVTRLSVLAVSATTPSLVLVISALRGDYSDDIYLGIGSLILLALVVARIWDLVRVLHDQHAALARTARTDPLTGVANRRSWDFELARSMAATGAGTLLVALLDLDHFKKYNDVQGHQGGDDLLREVARAWSLAIGPNGRIARWGGEEFAVALSCPDVESGVRTLDELRAVVPFGQTCSIGVAHWEGTQNAEEILHRADEALYRAKHDGRDRLVLWSAEVHPAV